MILHPGENFNIVRVLNDPTDTNTYYVQAIVRKSSDGSTLQTINLTDNGSRRFTGDWEVTHNIGADGSYIDITITVYTDSGYTTVSGDYAEENKTYLVQERLTRVDLPAGGADINYKKLRSIVKEEVDNRKMQEIKETNLGGVETSLNDVLQAIKDIRMPEPEKIDYEAILSQIRAIESSLAQRIKEKEVTPITNLESILEKNTQENQQLSKKMEAIANSLIKTIDSNNQKTIEFIDNTKKKFDMSDKIKELIGEPLSNRVKELIGEQQIKEQKKQRLSLKR